MTRKLKADVVADNERLQNSLTHARSALRDIRTHARAAFDENKVMNTFYVSTRSTEGIER